jgi:putative tricarboxylic transport membrane protein
VIGTALTDLWYGFGVALEPHNIVWCFLGVLVGNMVGVLPGMGPLATISILLPLTFGIKPVGAILMLAGVMYGAQYGGAICSILLNLPCHPPHAVTCLDGFPMTKQGRGGVALGVTVFASFVGASWGITEMIFLAPVLVKVAMEFGPAEICSLMLLGLLAGSTLARGSPVKGVAMTVLGLMLGIVGTDIETGAERFTFGMTHLDDARTGPVRHRRVYEQHQPSVAGQCQIRQGPPPRHAADQGRHEALVLADDPRHNGRQPVLAHSRHRPDHCLLRRLCDGEESVEDTG